MGVQVPPGAYFLKMPKSRGQSPSYVIPRVVVWLTAGICLVLGAALWNINPWPTDAEAYYLPAAFRLPHLQYLSQIHANFDMEHVRWLHGKEMFIAAISAFQFLCNDFETLRPLMLLGIVCAGACAILVFVISRWFWGEKVGFVCYLLFAFCLWPYVYVVFAKHQPMGLLFFLLAVVFLLKQEGQWRYLGPLLSGVSFGIAYFSSTVTTLYAPYYAAVFFVARASREETFSIKPLVGRGVLVLAGILGIVFYVNLPNIGYNLQSFIKYVSISGAFNHFYYNQPALQQWFAPNVNVGLVRGGWEWVLKYFFLIMPVLFPLYLAASGYLLYQCVIRKDTIQRLKILGLIVLSITAPLLAEMARVSQYGANYFPALIGILVVIALALKMLEDQPPVKSPWLARVLAGVLALHIAVNGYLFVSDVYVCRMATTFLSNKIQELNIDRIATYREHFHRNFFVACLSPQARQQVGWVGIQQLIQPGAGHILVPPISGDSLYIASSSAYTNYDKDIFLVQMARQGLLKDFAVASFKTLINSRIWRQEEEILSYRSLILGQDGPAEELGRVWLLDAKKIQAQQARLYPSKSDIPLLKRDVNNIGTVEKYFMFEGQRIIVPKARKVQTIVSQVWKAGDPQDALIMSVYRSDPAQPIWLPAGQKFASLPLSAQNITDNPQGIAVFTFDPPLDLERNVYYVVIYRTGIDDDRNYYQIHNQRFAVP